MADVDMEVARRNVDRLGIKYDELPQYPFWAQFTGRTNEKFKQRVAAKIMAGSAAAGRELTQPEKDALAQHFAQLLRTSAYDTPIALVSALGFYRATYAKSGFPLWNPNPEKFNINKFPGLPEGLYSRKMWHGIRMLSWYAGCKVLVSVFCVSIAISRHESHYATDPRLQDYRQTLLAKRQQHMQQRARQLSGGARPSTGTIKPAEHATTAWSGAEQSTQDAQSTWPGMQSTPQPESTQASYNDEPYTFEDASPVAPAQQEQQQVSPRQSHTQGASAWDKIRNQARGGGAAQGQGPGGQASAWGQKRQDELTSRGAQDGTSYTFSSEDEERAYAKEQAQKEFDEMLERERKGQAGSSKRW